MQLPCSIFFTSTFGTPRKSRSIVTRWFGQSLPDFVTAYAATHPQEDFAETFRFYVARRGRLRELFAEFGRKRQTLRAVRETAENGLDLLADPVS